MKKIWLIICCFLSCSLCGYSQGIEFREESFEEVLKMAKEQNKLVFIDVYTSWCGPCKEMLKNVFPDPAVGEFYNKHFLCMKVDAEKPENAYIKKFRASAYPTYLVLDGDGNLRYRFMGGMPADKFIEEGRNALGANQPKALTHWLNLYAYKSNVPGPLHEFVKNTMKRGLDLTRLFERYWMTRGTGVLAAKSVRETLDDCQAGMMDIDKFMAGVVASKEYEEAPIFSKTGPVPPITGISEPNMVLSDMVVKNMLEIMQVQAIAQAKDYALREKSRELFDYALALWDNLPENDKVGEREVFELEFLQATDDRKAYIGKATAFLNRLMESTSRELLLERGKKEAANTEVLGLIDEWRPRLEEMYCDLYFNYVETIIKQCMAYTKSKKQLADVTRWAEYAASLKPGCEQTKRLGEQVKNWK